MSRKGTAGFRSPNLASKSKAGQAQKSDRLDTPKPRPALSVVERSVMRSGLSSDSFVRLLIQSALSRLTIWSQADLDRLLMLSERLGLDPLNNEIYATEVTPENGKKARMVFVVGVDGWSKIINSHPKFDGMKFVESAPGDDELPLYIECTIFRKDRRVATSIREYMYEAHTGQGAWLTHPRRMLRHKAMVQCARACFGLGGVYARVRHQMTQVVVLYRASFKLATTKRSIERFALVFSGSNSPALPSSTPNDASCCFV